MCAEESHASRGSHVSTGHNNMWTGSPLNLNICSEQNNRKENGKINSMNTYYDKIKHFNHYHALKIY